MPGYYVFELHFKGPNDAALQRFKELELVIVDESSMADFSKFREDLRKCAPEPFLVQYYDEEDDVVSIDTQEEFTEFLKVAKKRSAKGMLIKLILNLSSPLDRCLRLPQKQHPSGLAVSEQDSPFMFPSYYYDRTITAPLDRGYVDVLPGVPTNFEHINKVKKMVAEESNAACGSNTQQESDEMPPLCLAEAASKAADYCMRQLLTKHNMMKQEEFDKLEVKIKNSLRKELMDEMKDQLGEQTKPGGLKEVLEYEEDSDGNIIYLLERNSRKKGHYQKKLEKREKAVESKIDQRLEKLELKKKKLLEKASLRTVVSRKPVDPSVSMPFIMSVIATKESSTLPKKVTVGKVFLHVLHIINDGTVAWSNVELRHTWSTPGLEPDETSIKCVPLLPGQESQVAMKFKAPKTVTSFISYWHFFYQFDSRWQQFGHYISVTGNAKMPKTLIQHTVTKVQDNLKKDKQETKAEGENEIPVASKEEKIMNKETKSLYQLQLEAGKKHFEASLASAEIAAEMAREAANAAFRRAIGLTPANTADAASTELAKLNKCLDEVVESVQSLSVGNPEESPKIPDLEDNASDKEANIDVNEESDPGFVVVNIPTLPDQRKIIVEPITVVHEKDKNIILFERDNKLIAESASTPVAEVKGDEINGNEQVEDIFNHAEKNDKIDAVKECEPLTQSVPKPNINMNNAAMTPPDEYAYDKLDGQQQQQPNMGLPRPEPTINFVYPPPPQRVTMAVMPPAVSHQHNPHPGFPVFTPQNSSSHAIVFPPPPLIHFSTPKINPPIHYPQIPTYPPIPSTPHPMPLLSSGIPPATMAPQPTMQMGPPQMNPQPVVNPHFPMNRMMPMHVHQAYEHASGNSVIATPLDPLSDFKPPSSSKNSPMPSTKTTITTANNLGTEHNASFVPLSVNIYEAKEPSNSAPFTASAAIGNTPTETAAGLADQNKKPESVVQILPQALVDGAINVASSAYSSAWNALNNLRPKEGYASEFDPVFENNMALLVEMGFINMERNGRLLKQYHNDVNQVIGIICANGGSDNLNID